jgi:hypothetical protein
MRDVVKFAEKMVALAPYWNGNMHYWKFFIYKGKTYVFNYEKISDGYVCKPAFEDMKYNFKETPVEAIVEELKEVWK